MNDFSPLGDRGKPWQRESAPLVHTCRFTGGDVLFWNTEFC
jgi:hypothetical protein